MYSLIIIRFVIIFLLTCIANVNDLKNYKISNFISLSGMILATVCNIYVFCNGGDIKKYIVSAVGVFLSLYVVYLFGGIGAGDAKLLTVITFLTGVNGVYITVISFFVGGAMGIAGLIFKRLPVRLINAGGYGFNAHIIHFSIAILISEIIVFVGLLWKG